MNIETIGMLPVVDLQEMNEEQYNRRHIDAKIQLSIAGNPAMAPVLENGYQLVKAYIEGTYYESKMLRVVQLRNVNIRDMVMELFVGIAYFQVPELFTSAMAQIAARLNFSDRVSALTTTAELVAVLCQTDAFDITKASAASSLMIVSKIPLEKELIRFVMNSQYLPPMVCTPLVLTHNFSSGYLTHNDSLLLGSGNHHDGDLSLDVLNIMGSVALKISTEFLGNVEEESTHALDTREKRDQWAAFKAQSYAFYKLIVDQGNKFYLNHKVDKRGRIYASGYHINTMGSAFKKASIEFAREELVEGVP